MVGFQIFDGSVGCCSTQDCDGPGICCPAFRQSCQTEWENLESVMLSDHCMMWFDHRKRLYLCTCFSALNFGYTSTQPIGDKDSFLGMRREMSEAPYKFIEKGPS